MSAKGRTSTKKEEGTKVFLLPQAVYFQVPASVFPSCFYSRPIVQYRETYENPRNADDVSHVEFGRGNEERKGEMDCSAG